MSTDDAEWTERRATAVALKLLARREHATAELDEKLRRRGVPVEVRSAVIRTVTAWNALDDGRMAREYVRVRHRDKGRYALLRDLEARGVGEADRDAAVAELTDDAQEAAAADLLRRRMWRFASGDPRTRAAKAGAYLARRGFDHQIVRDVVVAAFGDPTEHADGADDVWVDVAHDAHR